MHSKIGHSGANIVKEFFSSGTGDSTSLVTSMVIIMVSVLATEGFISSHAIVKYNWLAVRVGHFIGRTYFVTALLRVMEV